MTTVVVDEQITSPKKKKRSSLALRQLVVCLLGSASILLSYGSLQAAGFLIGCLGVLLPTYYTERRYFSYFGASKARNMLAALALGEFMKMGTIAGSVLIAVRFGQAPVALLGIGIMLVLHGTMLYLDRGVTTYVSN